MISLANLQNAFIQTTQENNTDLFLSAINAPTLNIAQYQLKLYQTTIQSRFQTALASIYPVCYIVLGNITFNELSLHYHKQYPSQSYDLNAYGAAFSKFINTHLDHPLPYLADLAHLEWAWHSLYYASCELQPFPFERLTELSLESFRFVLPSCSTLLQSAYPLHHIWQNPQSTFISTHEPYYYFIWQSEYNLHLKSITYSEWRILKWIQEGFSFQEIVTQTEYHKLNISLPTKLPEWIQHRIIIDIEKITS